MRRLVVACPDCGDVHWHERGPVARCAGCGRAPWVVARAWLHAVEDAWLDDQVDDTTFARIREAVGALA